MSAIADFVENKKICGVYAENAFNTVSSLMNVKAFSYEMFYINEIDNLDDYEKVSKDIQMRDYKDQENLYSFDCIKAIIKRYKIYNPLIVIDPFLRECGMIKDYFKLVQPVWFDGFKPNPEYDEVVKAVKLFKENLCDGIIAIGGGSAIDVAKAVKLFVPLNGESEYLGQNCVYTNLKLIAVPTTAGTGSESTKYSVIYYKGEKLSLTQDFLVPDVAILDTMFLKTLPLNQKKVTLFDALCHAVESIWSINASQESISCASEAIRLILPNIARYFDNDETVFSDIIKASNLSGKAINISQTTAAHAMSYKLTSLYHVPHGQAVAVCLPGVWEYLIKHANCKIKNYLPSLGERLLLLDKLFCGDAISVFSMLLKKYNLTVNYDLNTDLLSNSVNSTRLKNFPVAIGKNDIQAIYSNLSLKK